MSTLNLTRNIGISAHIDSGKTTLTERILYYTGVIHKIEEVRGGGDGATMDHMELEKEKGITITSAATTVHWNESTSGVEHKINIIDTPGHVDFTVEVERSLRVLDGAILVLCGVAGVQSQSITVDRQMKRYRVPRMAFINKLDRTGADPYQVCSDLREKLELNAVMAQMPIGIEDSLAGVVDLVAMKAYYNDGEKGEVIRVEDIPADMLDEAQQRREELIEACTMFDEQMMEDVLEGKDISDEAIHAAMKIGVQTLELCPVYCGSAFKNRGVQPLIDAVCRYLPSPIEAEPAKAKVVGNEEEVVTMKPVADEPLCCMAFKIAEEQFGQLTYTRIYQGTLSKGMSIINSRTGKKIRLGRLIRMHSNDRANIESASAGDIVAMVGVDCASGDTFCDENIEVTLESMFVPEPVISYSVSVPESADQEKMGKAIQRFVKEDPTFRVRTDEESGETIISGMGELHLDIYVERMQREYGVGVEVGPPQVNYREAITRPTDYSYTHRKQTGGSGQFAVVMGSIEPIDMDAEGAEEFVFDNQIKGGNIPTEFIPACEKGFQDVMAEGPLGAFPVVGVHVNLRDGKYHEVDSSDMAFRTASRNAMREAIRKAGPVLLEPIMKVEVETPTEYQGSVVGDLSSRRGVIGGMDTKGNLAIITSSVPLSEMFGYSTAVRSMSAGKASYSMEFEKYSACPRNIQEEVMASRKDKVRNHGDD